MSIYPVIDCLKKLLRLHKNLIIVSEHKTEALKKGDIEQLQGLLLEEKKNVQAIHQIEGKRQRLINEWEKQYDIKLSTGDDIARHITDGQLKQQLEFILNELAEQIDKLKQKELLNKQLVQHSLQFIQLTFDMVQPSIKTMNYSRNYNLHSAESESSSRSIFDSKA